MDLQSHSYDFRFLQENETHHSNGTLKASSYESKIKCTWSKDDFYSTASAKKGISASLFILFLCYTIMVMVRSCKKGTGVSIKVNSIF